MDFFADNMVRRIIAEIIKNKGEIKTNEEIWYSMTKFMFNNFPAIEVWKMVEQASEETSDEQWFEHKYSKEQFNESWVYPKERKKIYRTNNKLKELINKKLKITNIAKKYGLDTDKRGKTTCPFHYDSEPSLYLDDSKNVFYCFGCHEKGDIITFIKKMEDIKIGDKKRC